MSLVSYAVTGNSTRRPYWHQLTKKVAQIRSKNEFFHQSSVVYSGASTPQLEAVWWSPRQVHPILTYEGSFQDGDLNGGTGSPSRRSRPGCCMTCMLRAAWVVRHWRPPSLGLTSSTGRLRRLIFLQLEELGTASALYVRLRSYLDIVLTFNYFQLEL